MGAKEKEKVDTVEKNAPPAKSTPKATSYFVRQDYDDEDDDESYFAREDYFTEDEENDGPRDRSFPREKSDSTAKQPRV